MTKNHAPRPLYPLVMVSHPERGRFPERMSPTVAKLVYTGVWKADDRHPLGGCEGVVVLYRRVNLRKDTLPRWIKDRPLYEFTKEQTA